MMEVGGGVRLFQHAGFFFSSSAYEGHFFFGVKSPVRVFSFFLGRRRGRGVGSGGFEIEQYCTAAILALATCTI